MKIIDWVDRVDQIFINSNKVLSSNQHTETIIILVVNCCALSHTLPKICTSPLSKLYTAVGVLNTVFQTCDHIIGKSKSKRLSWFEHINQLNQFAQTSVLNRLNGRVRAAHTLHHELNRVKLGIYLTYSPCIDGAKSPLPHFPL